MPLKKAKPAKLPRRIRIETVRSTDLTLEVWRRSPELVDAAMKLSNDPNFRLLMDMLRNESPVNYGLPQLGVQPTDRIAHQSKVEGYHLVLNNIEAAQRLENTSAPIEAVFENPDPSV